MLRTYLNSKKELILGIVIVNQLIAMYRVWNGVASPWFAVAFWSAVGGLLYLALSFTWFAVRQHRLTAGK